MKPRKRVAPFGAAAGDQKRSVQFTFDGKPYEGLEGDTLAAALLANGVEIVGRSFKLHRPRGIMGYWVEETNGLVQLESGKFDEPNVRSTMMPLYPGLKASSQNAWPNAQHDVLGVMDKFSKLLPASFYYKSMMWPNWHFYERFVRHVAGLGKAPKEPDAQKYHKQNAHCDLLVVGGGPSGLAAALVAGRAGVRVIVADDREEFGGSLLGERFLVDGQPGSAWVQATVAQLAEMPNVQLLPRTNVSGYYEGNFLAAAQRVTNHLGPNGQEGRLRERLWRIRAKTVILATGAIERPLVFANNDRPGVMLASAVRMYVNRFGVLSGSNIVVATNNDDAYRTALDLSKVGVKKVCVVDTRARVDNELVRLLRERGIRHYVGHAIRDVVGKRKVRGLRVSPHRGGGQLDRKTMTIECDLVAMSSGWTPTVHLFSQAGGTLRYDETLACLVPGMCSQNVQVIGAANGAFPLPECIKQGIQAGEAAVARLGRKVAASRLSPKTHAVEKEPFRIEPYWYTKSVPMDQQWLDFQYDVKVSDVNLAMKENFRSVEHVKRYTTGGMSIDQGKSSNFNILAVMAELSGQSIEKVGTTRFRPPYQPVTIGAFAGSTRGELYAPWQTLHAASSHAAARASFADYGWQRPECYLRDNENVAAATKREALAVRNGVGMFDGSPLGKLEVKGPDTATFLNRMYVNNLASLKVGAARYAMLTNENGVLIDDGVVVRLAHDHFLVHATSASVGRVFLLMEELLQCEWPDLRVFVNNVTSQWANVTVSGPMARVVMQDLDSDIDFDAEKFPHMHFRAGKVAGIPVRVLRASFTGEVTYEISIANRYGKSLWDTVAAVGERYGITPYGIEALEVLRTEKGYIHIGADTDGNSNPLDIGWAKIIEKKAGDFIGRRSLQRPADKGADRLEYVGLESLDPGVKLPVGGHFVGDMNAKMPTPSQGYVTSSCISPTLHKSIGMGILRNGGSRLGEVVNIYAKGKMSAARIVPTAHLDSKGERLNG
ncbi:sarcosine oxidase subunit alpha family protein [Paraburkholderia phenoliruptrix]|uniref:sarcosine oxidase subunit alpha family protein n=1 Tax=Paraburkholderia phenoliruptrix TaxID=252970 RepID=UPI0028699854|nr:sarcosine oxidase subunit alpha family protein [Paraburkholderia phenoliruptrix]WMY11069.1 sarcosine oxidase subunit alpha family protein [Paraburkholderia phenoliruptrix]